METTSITFITGGVRSGKSSFAEKVAMKNALEIGGNLHYIATGLPSDDEMEKRIIRHQEERRNSGFLWETWEQATDIGDLAPCFTEKDIVVLDCLTILLTNELFSQKAAFGEASHIEEICQRILTGIKALGERCHRLLIVSNEVLFEPSHGNELVYTYCQLIGKLHQHIVKIANQAYIVELGVPLLMKGDKP